MDATTAVRSLAALAHARRLAIFRLLVEQGSAGIAAGRIAERLRLPAATASFHLKELANAGLAIAQPQSRFIYYRANYAVMNGLVDYLTENCCSRGGACEVQCAPRAVAKKSRRRAA
ncbi:MAG TPA: winged helix-turn-helix domain-containing protein [Casimicrobiaceae bacterium]|jgi:DNA-binding transcriptional ArsR family regulator